MLILRGLGKADSVKGESGKCRGGGGANSASGGKGFEGMSKDPWFQHTNRGGRSRVIGGTGVADKGRRSFLRRVKRQGEYNVEVLNVNVYLMCNSNDWRKC